MKNVALRYPVRVRCVPDPGDESVVKALELLYRFLTQSARYSDTHENLVQKESLHEGSDIHQS
jgi:hypothetical protein